MSNTIDDRKRLMQRQRKKGMTYEAIAHEHQLTRQRVHAILGPDPASNEVGKFCKAWRKRLDLSQEEACKVLGVSFQPWLSNLENAAGKFPMQQPGIMLMAMKYYEQLCKLTESE